MEPSLLEFGAEAFATTTDLYQLLMAAAYFAAERNPVAHFEVFVRTLPKRRNYLVAAGLAQALEYLERVAFRGGRIDALRRLPSLSRLDPAFFELLRELRFTGDVRAMPEGTVFFENEPILSVRAPLIEAQIVETFLLSVLGYETTVATKAARIVEAARGRDVVDFGLRRGHGPAAGLLAARAAMIGGCAATSDVEAALRLGVPASGTMAHSYVLSCRSEAEAFGSFVRCHGAETAILLDTFDTEAAARQAVAIDGLRFGAVRLDSGDLLALSKSVRRILDGAGRKDVKIVASGDLAEDSIARLVEGGAPIDGFGVGTDLVTSRDEPALGIVYKLVAIEEDGRVEPKAKRSAGKATLPYPKEVFRTWAGDVIDGDMIAVEDEIGPEGGRALLQPVMAFGHPLDPQPTLPEIRERCRKNRESLPERLRRLERSDVPYPVLLSARLRSAQAAGAP